VNADRGEEEVMGLFKTRCHFKNGGPYDGVRKRLVPNHLKTILAARVYLARNATGNLSTIQDHRYAHLYQRQDATTFTYKGLKLAAEYADVPVEARSFGPYVE
jgi:hypothetical protein